MAKGAKLIVLLLSKKTKNLLSSMGISQVEVAGEVLKECITALQEAKIIPVIHDRVDVKH